MTRSTIRSRERTMSRTSVANILSGRVSVGNEVVVQGWVRTRRDSKAGLSFVNVHDGSCFDAIQVICTQELANYNDEVLKLSPGRSEEHTSELQSRGHLVCRLLLEKKKIENTHQEEI